MQSPSAEVRQILVEDTACLDVLQTLEKSYPLLNAIIPDYVALK